MTQSSFSKTAKAAALGFVAALALAPFFVSAVAFRDKPLTPPFKLVFRVKLGAVNSTNPWSAALAVTPNTPFTLNFSAPGATCGANWEGGVVAPADATLGVLQTGTLDKTKTFVLTCSGIGIAQTAKVQVVIAKPDLVVSTPRFSSVSRKGGKFLAGNARVSVVVQNNSKVPVTTPFNVKVFKKKNAEAFEITPFLSVSAGPLKPGEKVVKEWIVNNAVDASNTYTFKACVDDATENGERGVTDLSEVSESNEKNNCSSPTSGFTFIVE